jgi:predicted DNA-binding protein
MKINDNIKSLQKTLNKGSSSSSSSKKFIIKNLKLDSIVISAKSEKLNLDKSINFENLEFKNIGNTKDSKDYKTVLKETINKAMKDMKNKVLSGNAGNALNKVKNIDQNKIKEKIKKELFQNKDKVKNKLKKLLNKN